MTSRRVQIKYDALAQQYEAWMLKLNDLHLEQMNQRDPAVRATLQQQIAEAQQACAALEQQLDALEQQLQPGRTQDIDNPASNQARKGSSMGR